jgi:hypothetical protein
MCSCQGLHVLDGHEVNVSSLIGVAGRGSQARLAKVINYFEEYPLKSSKSLLCSYWSIVYGIISKKLHISKYEQTYKEIRLLKSATPTMS